MKTRMRILTQEARKNAGLDSRGLSTGFRHDDVIAVINLLGDKKCSLGYVILSKGFSPNFLRSVLQWLMQDVYLACSAGVRVRLWNAENWSWVVISFAVRQRGP